MPEPSPKKRAFQAPTGTRDFYPREMLVRRYITDAWRRTSLRHGFDEVDGPTFESAELYKVKSGEGILNEMFGVFSGKAEGGRRAVEPGAPATGSVDDAPDLRNPPFGLRPEFTPTLARMYAARAKQLPQPTKWFCVSNFFRAERPQRGRLREFWQWNCDVIGGENTPDAKSDVVADALSVQVDLFVDLGLTEGTVQAKVSNRILFDVLLIMKLGMNGEQRDRTLAIIDKRGKMTEVEWRAEATRSGITSEQCDAILELLSRKGVKSADDFLSTAMPAGTDPRPFFRLFSQLDARMAAHWCTGDTGIVRGLAYYTGTVFEVIAEGERAVAGGGRYDNLIELFGGPPTPACGFGMGDAVLGNLLEDRKLIPEGREMLEALSRPMPLRPDVFVIASPNEGCEELIVPTVARLRRGEESEKYKQGECRPWSAERYTVPPMHARRSYKATKNVGKLVQEAVQSNARMAAIIESAGDDPRCTIQDLDRRTKPATGVPLEHLGERIMDFILR